MAHVSLLIVLAAIGVSQAVGHDIEHPAAWARPGQCLVVKMRSMAGSEVESLAVRTRPEGAR